MKVQVGQKYIFRPVKTDLTNVFAPPAGAEVTVKERGQEFSTLREYPRAVILNASLMKEIQKWSWRFSNDQI